MQYNNNNDNVNNNDNDNDDDNDNDNSNNFISIAIISFAKGALQSFSFSKSLRWAVSINSQNYNRLNMNKYCCVSVPELTKPQLRRYMQS